VAIARFAAAAWHAGTTAQPQLEIARLFFGDVPIIQSYQAFVNEDSNRVLFSEQQFFLTLRLLVDHARDHTGDARLSPQEAVMLSRLVVGAGTIADEPPFALGPGLINERDLLAYFIQNGAFYARENLLGTFSRTFAIFVRLAREFASEPWAMPLDAWISERFPLSLDEQLAVGFALFSLAGAANPDADATARSVIGLPNGLAQTAFVDRHEEIRTVFGVERFAFKTLLRSAGRTLGECARDATPFMQAPFLRLSNGNLLLWSPRCLAVWLSDGVYYRLLDIASAKTNKKNNTLERYTSFVGRLLEQWAVRLASAAFSGDRPPGAGRVHGEIAYGKGLGSRTPDVLIDLGEDLVAIEVRSGYLRRESRTGPDPDAVMRDIDRLVIRKVEQLGRRIHDIVSGAAPIPDVDQQMIRRVGPILVTANITQPEVLHDYIQRNLPATFEDARVQTLVLMDPEDLEALMALAEAGASIIPILAERQSTEYARLEFARWVQSKPELEAAQAHAKLAERYWKEQTEDMIRIIRPSELESDAPH
jgi:hypothetical protein